MSLENLPKRRLVIASTSFDFESKVNALADYTVEEFSYTPVDDDHDETFVALMRLKVEPDADFTGVEDAMVLPLENYTPGTAFGSPLIWKATTEGWRIIAIYKGTKDTPSTAIVVRRKKKEEKHPNGKIVMSGKTWTIYDSIHLDETKTLEEALNEMVEKGLAKEEK